MLLRRVRAITPIEDCSEISRATISTVRTSRGRCSLSLDRTWFQAIFLMDQTRKRGRSRQYIRHHRFLVNNWICSWLLSIKRKTSLMLQLNFSSLQATPPSRSFRASISLRRASSTAHSTLQKVVDQAWLPRKAKECYPWILRASEEHIMPSTSTCHQPLQSLNPASLQVAARDWWPLNKPWSKSSWKMRKTKDIATCWKMATSITLRQNHTRYTLNCLRSLIS